MVDYGLTIASQTQMVHTAVIKAPSMFGTDKVPWRLIEFTGAACYLLDSGIAANASNSRVIVWRLVALGVNPLNLAGLHSHLPFVWYGGLGRFGCNVFGQIGRIESALLG